MVSTKSFDLLSRFGEWASANAVERFWGVATAGAAGPCLVMPALDPTFRGILIGAQDDDELFLVVGDSASGSSNEQFYLGEISDDPGDLLTITTAKLVDRAVIALDDGNLRLARQLAHMGYRIAYETRDTAQAMTALDIFEAAKD